MLFEDAFLHRDILWDLYLKTIGNSTSTQALLSGDKVSQKLDQNII